MLCLVFLLPNDIYGSVQRDDDVSNSNNYLMLHIISGTKQRCY